MLGPSDVADIAAEAQRTIEAALAFAQSSPDPDPADLLRDVYAA